MTLFSIRWPVSDDPRIAFGDFDESKHPRDDHGKFASADHPDVKAFVAKYPSWGPKFLDEWRQKHGDDAVRFEVQSHMANQRREPGFPSVEFQKGMQNAVKVARAEHRANEKAARAPIVKAALEKRGLAVGDTVYDKEHGVRGTVQLDKRGEPEIVTAQGKHNLGDRWEKQSATVDWTPVPRKPWAVRDVDGRAIRRFETAEQANAHLAKATRKGKP